VTHAAPPGLPSTAAIGALRPRGPASPSRHAPQNRTKRLARPGRRRWPHCSPSCWKANP